MFFSRGGCWVKCAGCSEEHVQSVQLSSVCSTEKQQMFLLVDTKEFKSVQRRASKACADFI